jgi:hypothetical protein
MGRKSRRKESAEATPPPKAGPTRLVILAAVVAAAIALAIATWRPAPPEDPPPPAPAAAERRAAPPPAPPVPPPAPASAAQATGEAPEKFRPLLGEWRRPDGGYVLAVTGIAEDGTATAGYFNPQPINVGQAEARTEDGELVLFVKMQDRNYPGSTYTLTYDPTSDQLVGIYFQAVQRASYDVVFVRR